MFIEGWQLSYMYVSMLQADKAPGLLKVSMLKSM